MSLLLAANPDLAYPLLVGTVGVYSVLVYAGAKVSGARKAAGVAYPAPYADNALAEKDDAARKFNCAQRAHMNTLENLPVFLLTLFHSSLFHPKAAAGAGALYLAGRFAYIAGYTTGDPKKRSNGFFGYLGLLPLFGFSVFKAFQTLPVFHK
ncbi:hypothetical protein JCM10207_007441 [Rhodosporidiobolus poonsookiae]